MMARRALLILALLPALAAAEGGAPPQASELRHQAAALAQQRRYDEAAGLYEQAAALRPQDIFLHKDLMWTLWYAGRYDKALDAARRTMRLAPNDLEALNLMGQSQLAMGDEEEALSTYKKSFRLDPGQLPVRKALARIHQQMRDYDEAVAAYRDLAAREPREPLWHSALGHVYFDMHRFDESEAELGKASTLAPDNLEFKTKRAQALYFGGRKKEGTDLLWKLASAKPPYWPAILYAVDLSSVNGRAAEGAALLAGHLDKVTPEDEPKLEQLSLIYKELGMEKEYLSASRRLLKLNANSPMKLNDMASYFLSKGDAKESARLSRLAIKTTPDFFSAWGGVSDSLELSSQPVKALAAHAAELALDPTDTTLIIDQARLLYSAGRHKESRDAVLRFLAGNEKVFLPILLFHGLTPFSDDPMLAAPIHLTTDRFDEHIRALRDAGFTPITATLAADWFKGKARLPAKPILVTFDDARFDSIRYGDPVLKKYGFKATMFSPMYNVELGSTFYADWKLLKEKAGNGVWEIQAHGDHGHNFIPVDAAGRTGLFLVHKLWREDKKRLETDAEWKARVREDHESSKRKIRKRLGYEPRVFAYPEGDYGQQSATNFNGVAAESLRLCRRSYEVCLTQNSRGMNLRWRDPARAWRVEPRQDWSGRKLIELFGDENPFTLAYRVLMAEAVWEKKTREAFGWLDQERASGASPKLLLADEARVRFGAGEQSRGLALARQALALDNGPDNQSLVQSMSLVIRPKWTPGIEYYSDSRTRRNLLFSQSVGSWSLGANELSLSQFYGTYREHGFGTITDNGGGADYKRLFGPFQSLALRLEGHHYSEGVKDGVAAQGDLHSEWTDTFNTDLQGVYRPYDTDSALRANIRERHAKVQGTLGTDDSWKGTLQSQFASLTDNNRRYTDQLTVAHPVRTDSNFLWIGQFLYDATSFVSPYYYSPQNLLQFQAGLGYKGQLTPEIKVDANYLPGYGRETHTRGEFIETLDLGLEKNWGDSFSIKPGFSITKTPTYQNFILAFSFSYRL